MSIKPVDFQVMIPRTMEVSKFSNEEINKNNTMQQQLAATTQHLAENTLKQVYSQKRAQNARINGGQREKGSSGKEQKKGKNEDSGEKVQEKTMQTTTIDIKV
ncbi:MAG: hypothetical protein FIA99_06740 [Ruminiclostridium sp.]|nr:hypothetical protein [Ruminiclostridium sp.]